VSKPKKPTPDYPLFAHANGKWAKKVGGRIKYFGRWDDPDAALAEYQKSIRPVEQPGVGLPISTACNLFMAAQESKLNTGELSRHSLADYHRTCKAMLDHFGKMRPVEDFSPHDFTAYKAVLAKTKNTNSLGNEITRVRTVFKWAHDSNHLTTPVRFGPDFRRPSKVALRRHRREQGKRLFTADQILLLLDEVGVHFYAMILLGINCGFGNTDVAKLKLQDVDLPGGWIHFPRPKTEVERSCPLWQETVDALSKSLVRRREPKEPSELFFITPEGTSWEKSAKPITKQFAQARKRAGIQRGGFYWLRHTFETIAGACKDQVAVNAIMGHVDSSMAGVYREEISKERLVAAVEEVRKWLFKSNP
jgi:integrase